MSDQLEAADEDALLGANTKLQLSARIIDSLVSCRIAKVHANIDRFIVGEPERPLSVQRVGIITLASQSNSMMTASTARLSPVFASTFFTRPAFSARRIFSIFIASITASG